MTTPSGMESKWFTATAMKPPSDSLNRFTIAIDVIGHELTHGVTQFEAKLVYSQQPGALNKSMSDVFGSLVKQYSLIKLPTRQIGSSARVSSPRV